MVAIPENLRELINADSRSFKARLINGDDTYEQIISLKRSVVFPSSTMSIGNSLCTCIECTASDIPVSITGKKLDAEITIYESAEWIKLGSFTAQKPTVQNGNVTFTAYDAMDKASNSTYKSTLSEGAHTTAEYFDDICAQLNESFVPLDEASAGFEIPEDKLSGYCCRDALSYLAGFLGKNCIVNRDGLFEMVSFEAVNYDMLNPDRIAEPELSDADSIISYLACCIDEETTLMSGEGSTGFEFISPLMTQERLDDLYNQLCNEGSAVRIYKAGRIVQLLGDPTLDICDVISLNYEGKVYTIPIMSLVFDFDGGLQAEIESFDLAEPNSLSLAERLSFAQKQAKEKSEGYVNAMVEFSQAIQKAYGVSNTEINGITYFHDTEAIESAAYIFCLTGKGIAFSDSWGGSHEKTVWKYGINNDGEAVLKMLKVFKIKADLIEAGQITSTDGTTYFNLDKGQIGTTVTETDENGEEVVKYSYRQDAEGVNLVTGLAITFEEFESNMTDEEKAEITKIEEQYPGTNAIVVALRTAAIAFRKYELWRKRIKGYEISSLDIENAIYHCFNFSSNKAFFTKLSGSERVTTEFSVDGIKSNKRLKIDAPGIDLPWVVLPSGTDFDTVLTPDDYSGDVVLGDGTNSNYLNSPTAIAASFSLEVIPTGRSNQRLQRLTLSSKGYSRKWERHYHSGSWGEWFCTYADRSTVLWSGAELMEARDKVINLSERISKQPTGIELVFSRVENGAPVDYHFETKFVSKGKVLTANGKGHGYSLFKQSTPFSAAGSKYLYIYDDRIEGNANNALSGTGDSGIKYDNSLWMLRQVNGV